MSADGRTRERGAYPLAAPLALLLSVAPLAAQTPDPPSADLRTGLALAVAGTYRAPLGGDLDAAEPPGGEAGPGAELVARFRHRRGLTTGIGAGYTWLEVDEAAASAGIAAFFAEFGYAFDLPGTPISPLLGSRLGYALESRSSPAFEGSHRAEGLDVAGFGGARFALSGPLALETLFRVSFVILDRTQSTRDRSGESLTVHAGLEYSFR